MAESFTVLLLEDEPMIAVGTAECLEDEGFSVIVAGSPSQALKVIADRGPELSAVFLDINLHAETTGFDVARAARLRCPGIAVLYTSGDRPGDFEARRVPDGGFIGKPYRHGGLADTLRDLIGPTGDGSFLDAAQERPRMRA
jgi:CheY-like chemotaxis protein